MKIGRVNMLNVPVASSMATIKIVDNPNMRASVPNIDKRSFHRFKGQHL